MEKIRIVWTEVTWNPVAGCSVISPGGTNCYAMRRAARFPAMGQKKWLGATGKSGWRSMWTGKVNLRPDAIDLLRPWYKGRIIFMNSMSDLCHPGVPGSFIGQFFSFMQDGSEHAFQILTERDERLPKMAHRLLDCRTLDKFPS